MSAQRDTRMLEPYFTDWIDYDSVEVARIDHSIATRAYPPRGCVLGASDVSGRILRRLVMRFSRGDAIVSLHDDLNQLLVSRGQLLHQCDQLPLEDQNYRAQFEDLREDHYVDHLWWLAIAVSAGMGSTYLARALTLIGNAGKDRLFDEIAILLVEDERVLGRQVLYRQYLPLMEAIASPSDRPGLVKKFLDGWYAGSRNVYWHGNHRDVDSGYMGYWAFEAALVVMLFDIDDAGFRDHEYYPADLVAHYRRRAGDRT
ncbi:PoNe immunity protein domain-containing protein [Stenotrophomonas sp. TWI143]|uniref:PoNe immunity protein domain-containing protein n=1 Tax=Stenotrophomonas TaxID=40323 RepID=UPI000DAA001A|nr:PoNe immunity protein domain-containing protein [Stenotrophomonas maltophilia]HDS1219547.1 DUF1911 domain-containing protein [Stenotrophomonas maltophilia]HDS1231022.1 DUF1911 domain-containing protein [Stenotrophomonas maltophilia]